MTFRLEFKMAAASIAALLHDIVITIGIYALVGFYRFIGLIGYT
ncbi:MAG: hypothetical protein ACQET3_06875 [Promethearchaeati archaeon]